MDKIAFDEAFQALTGNAPFPWQRNLYDEWFSLGKFPPTCNLPTGLGKTNVIAVWLIALANGCNVPRRLVYVVNRRTVVDQTTAEVEKYVKNLQQAGIATPLAISTLRGQFADNREWSADPSRPAVICGTVDMIGSRLLFSGYGIGFKARPLHAGFLGQDALLIHDEAHLEPAFQELLVAIEKEQERSGEFGTFHVVELSATSRGEGKSFSLGPADDKNAIVQQRFHAAKSLKLHAMDDEKKHLADKLVQLAVDHLESNRAILVFARSVETVTAVAAALHKRKLPVRQLTGTMRGLERDRLVADPVFQRFLPDAVPEEKTVYLVCTSAGEVGVNISADHLVCDLSPFDSMGQRFGRVNRFGTRQDSRIDVVHPSKFGDDPLEVSRARTLALLKTLKDSASPAALASLDVKERAAAFTPTPTILPVSDILFDAWALTTIRGKLPGRPPVEPYLHGIAEWQLPDTQVAWREEVEELGRNLESPREVADFEQFAAELLDDYPLKPHELLKEPSYRAFKHFEALAKAHPTEPAWLLDDAGKVTLFTLAQLADKDEKERIEGKIVLLPPSAGGLSPEGTLDGTSKTADDVADEWFADPERLHKRRERFWSNEPTASIPDDRMRLIRTIDSEPEADDAEEETAGPRYWHWCELANEGGKSSQKPVLWKTHVDDVVRAAEAIVANLPLAQELKDAVIFAARFHDHGKQRKQFQIVLGNRDYPKVILAKSGKKGGRIAEVYRHEFGSLLDVQREPEFIAISDEQKDLILHLIATHHGRGRPHFPAEEAFDPERHDTNGLPAEVPRRFARLQRRYGRWGLAYLESLLRAADWAASANPSRFAEDEG